MNKREIAEIRRRIKLDKNNITHIYGCYVNSAREIVSYIDESVTMLTQEENEKYLALLRKTLSGTQGRNLMNLSFATKQVINSDEVGLLTELRRSELSQEDTREKFFRKVIDAVEPGEGGYVILLAMDVYDVPHFGKDGSTDGRDSEVFKYMLCCLCPVKPGKVQFGYSPEDKRFQNFPPASLVSSPELGFMYPSFDDRSANIYDVLFYTHSTSDDHEDFINAVFCTEVPMSAEEQQQSFYSALTEALGTEASFATIKRMHCELSERISQHKESRDPEPLSISTQEMAEMLESCGLAAEQAKSFEESCIEEFGENAELSPENIIDSRKFKLSTPEVVVNVNPDYAELIEMRVIDGRKYILIPADSGVEINGLNVMNE